MSACRYPSDCKARRGQLVHHLRMRRCTAAVTRVLPSPHRCQEAPGRGGCGRERGKTCSTPITKPLPSYTGTAARECVRTPLSRSTSAPRPCVRAHEYALICTYPCSKTGLKYNTHALHCTVRHCSIRIHAFWHAQPRAQVTIAIAAVLFRPVDPHGLSRERHVPCIAAQRSGAHRMVSSPPHPRNRHNRTNQRCRGPRRCAAPHGARTTMRLFIAAAAADYRAPPAIPCASSKCCNSTPDGVCTQPSRRGIRACVYRPGLSALLSQPPPVAIAAPQRVRGNVCGRACARVCALQVSGSGSGGSSSRIYAGGSGGAHAHRAREALLRGVDTEERAFLGGDCLHCTALHCTAAVCLGETRLDVSSQAGPKWSKTPRRAFAWIERN